MKLNFKVNANLKPAQANITVDDGQQVFTSSLVKQSNGRFAINIEKIPNAPQKWVLVPTKADEAVPDGLTFKRDFDKDAKPKAKTEKTRYEVSTSTFLEQTLTAIAASPELTDDEVEQIQSVLKPIVDRLTKADERKAAEATIASLRQQLEEALAKLSKLSE